jgi:hypothetical protein
MVLLIFSQTANAYKVNCGDTRTMFYHNSVEVPQLKHTIILLIPVFLLFSQVAHAISYTKYLNGTKVDRHYDALFSKRKINIVLFKFLLNVSELMMDGIQALILLSVSAVTHQ